MQVRWSFPVQVGKNKLQCPEFKVKRVDSFRGNNSTHFWESVVIQGLVKRKHVKCSFSKPPKHWKWIIKAYSVSLEQHACVKESLSAICFQQCSSQIITLHIWHYYWELYSFSLWFRIILSEHHHAFGKNIRGKDYSYERQNFTLH